MILVGGTQIQLGDIADRAWSRMGRNSEWRKGNLVTKAARSGVKEFATEM